MIGMSKIYLGLLPAVGFRAVGMAGPSDRPVQRTAAAAKAYADPERFAQSIAAHEGAAPEGEAPDASL